MTVCCTDCGQFYDDARRWTICPHPMLSEPAPKPAARARAIGSAKRNKMMGVPTEEQEQRALAQWLDLHPWILWTATANGGKRSKAVAGKLKASGVKPGVPDILIFTPAPVCEERQRLFDPCRGTAIELKRSNGGATSQVQVAWVAALTEHGWHAMVCRGAQQAIERLEQLGYGKRP